MKTICGVCGVGDKRGLRLLEFALSSARGSDHAPPGWIREIGHVRRSYWRSLRTKLRYGLLHLLDVVEVTLNFTIR
jgi:hypothetical protein